MASSEQSPLDARPRDELKQEPHGEENEQPAEQAKDEEEQDTRQDHPSIVSEHGEEPGPGDRIEDFDWEGLLGDYEAKIAALNQKEADIYSDFDKLIKFFGVWAETVQTHELERSWKRINTRQTHVLHSEDELEVKRAHYVKVVEAFQSALQLLNGP